ncbi:MAG: hypothetical protein PVG39_25060 [Desulfobacteraceae bacterium]|jgi:hypothetical protein
MCNYSEEEERRREANALMKKAHKMLKVLCDYNKTINSFEFYYEKAFPHITIKC